MTVDVNYVCNKCGWKTGERKEIRKHVRTHGYKGGRASGLSARTPLSTHYHTEREHDKRA